MMTGSPGLGSLEARRGVTRRGTASPGGVISGDEEGACLGKDGALLFIYFYFGERDATPRPEGAPRSRPGGGLGSKRGAATPGALSVRERRLGGGRPQEVGVLPRVRGGWASRVQGPPGTSAPALSAASRPLRRRPESLDRGLCPVVADTPAPRATLWGRLRGGCSRETGKGHICRRGPGSGFRSTWSHEVRPAGVTAAARAPAGRRSRQTRPHLGGPERPSPRGSRAAPFPRGARLEWLLLIPFVPNPGICFPFYKRFPLSNCPC